MTSTGLLLAGQLVQVPGVTVLGPASHGGPARCRLHPGDYRARARPPWQLLAHSTKGLWPQHVKPGAGPPGREVSVADYWAQDPVHSAAHIVIGSDGTVACLGDLVRDGCGIIASCTREGCTKAHWSSRSRRSGIAGGAPT